MKFEVVSISQDGISIKAVKEEGTQICGAGGRREIRCGNGSGGGVDTTDGGIIAGDTKI